MLRYEYIKKYASESGFSLCGMARVRCLVEHSTRFEVAIAASGEGRLEYLVRNTERRFDPSALLSDAATVVVCALAYPRVEYAEPRVAAFARLEEDYHTLIKRMLREVLGRLQTDSPTLRGKVCCDTSPILEKAWAVEAGLGWQGRNSLLVTPEFGSFVLLGEIVLDEECDRYDERFNDDGCGSCRACVHACPVGAIGETSDGIRTINTALCISALTIEHLRLHPDTSTISGETCVGGPSRESVCGWIWGCDECQIACPKNNMQKIL